MNPSLKSLALAASAIVMVQTAGAAGPLPQGCAVKSRSDAVVLMHCPNSQDEKAWVEAARSACELGKACNVWIWDDLGKMPMTAPKTDAELPKSATGAAVAVWLNDVGSLMKLRKVK